MNIWVCKCKDRILVHLCLHYFFILHNKVWPCHRKHICKVILSQSEERPPKSFARVTGYTRDGCWGENSPSVFGWLIKGTQTEHIELYKAWGKGEGGGGVKTNMLWVTLTHSIHCTRPDGQQVLSKHTHIHTHSHTLKLTHHQHYTKKI